MNVTPGPAMVLARAFVLGATGLGIGVGSHLLGGGILPSAAVMLVLLAISVAVSVSLLRTWAGPLRLVALVVAAQTGWHLVLSLLSGHEGDVPVTSSTTPVVPLGDLGGSRTGSLYDAYLATIPTPDAPAGSGPGVMAHQVDHMVAQGLPMMLAHLLGAVLLGLFLARGEAALWRLVSLGLAAAQLALARWLVLAAETASRLVPDGRPELVVPTQVLGSQVLGRSTLRRRGPPLLLAA